MAHSYYITFIIVNLAIIILYFIDHKTKYFYYLYFIPIKYYLLLFFFNLRDSSFPEVCNDKLKWFHAICVLNEFEERAFFKNAYKFENKYIIYRYKLKYNIINIRNHRENRSSYLLLSHVNR